MKILVTQPILSLDNKPIKKTNEAGSEDFLVRDCFIEALLIETPVKQGATPASGKDKYERMKLAERIKETDEVEITLEEAVLLKNKVGEVWSALIVGRVYDLIDGTNK